MMNKKYFFKGQSVIRKIKDKALYDFIVAHKNKKDISYTPTDCYTGISGKYVTSIRVEGGSISMDYILRSGGGYISIEDWNLLFGLKYESAELLDLFNKAIKLASQLAVCEYQLTCCSYTDSEYYINQFNMAKSAFETADIEFKYQLRK